ncbi:MAG: hypothetical protein KME30_00270 [Iphinoe sp. HA4291-MV1]|nr:hypothetical protein [Iphinoe sp. HA4291-MV1]
MGAYFPCPPELKRAACEVIEEDVNQYAITWGDKVFRHAIASLCFRDHSTFASTIRNSGESIDSTIPFDERFS